MEEGLHSGLKRTFVKLPSALHTGGISRPRIGRRRPLVRALHFDAVVPGFKSCTDHFSQLHISGDPFYNFESSVFWQLYGDFADAFSLAECKLAIVHCAGHYDPTLIETLWRDIIDKGN